MECIICQDSGYEPLQDNTACPCKYKRHASCWIDYVHSKPILDCPICRKNLTLKTVAPYTLRTIVEHTGRIITYQEFVDTIHQNTVIHMPSPTPISTQNIPTSTPLTCNKFVKIFGLFGIIITVIILIMIFI